MADRLSRLRRSTYRSTRSLHTIAALGKDAASEEAAGLNIYLETSNWSSPSRGSASERAKGPAYVVLLQATGVAAVVRSGLLWSNAEAPLPAALAERSLSIGLPSLPAPRGGGTEAHTDALATALGTPRESLREVVGKATRRLEGNAALLRRSFDMLGPEGGPRFGRELGAPIAWVGNLTAVTRV